MKTELILQSDVIDIIFEKRNKAYGAYHLRKFYNNRLIKSLGLMLIGVVVLSAFTFIPTKKVVNTDKKDETILTQIWTEVKPEKKPEEPKVDKPVQKSKSATVQSTTNFKIVSPQTETPPINEITDETDIGTTTKPGTGGEQTLVGQKPADGPENGDGDKVPVTEPAVDNITPTAAPDIMPEFPGGMEGLRKFLQRHLTNPRDLEEDEKISVRVRFVVGYDGKIKSFEVTEDGGEAFNKEVIRVLKKMPDWTPGKTKGQNVSVYYTVPVKFIPQE
jgi:periplasmic protein TonB